MIDMTEKTKKWINYELENVTKRGWPTEPAKHRCYGIVMFVINELIGYDSPEGQELAKWWDDDMVMKFRELEMRCDNE